MIERLIRELEEAGYKCFVPLGNKSCFDIAARGERLLLLKVFTNIDSLRESQAENLKALASTLGAAPLVIGEKSKVYPLEEGMVYERYGISTISPETLGSVLRGAPPKRRFHKGRVVAEIDTGKLGNISPSELARELNVTREAVYSYKRGGRAEFKKARQMESFLDEDLIKGINIFSVPERGHHVLKGYLGEMHRLGFDVTPIHRGFDALAREKESLLVDSERNLAYAKQKAKFVKSAAGFFESHPVIVMESSQHGVDGVSIVKESEIAESGSAEGLLDLVKKRKRE